MRFVLAFVFMLCATAAQAVCTTGALPFNLQNNTVADATQVMANFNQISTGTAANCASSGSNTDITSLGGLTTPLSQLYGGTWLWAGGTSAGSANAQTLAAVTPATGFSLTQNKCVMFTAGFTNTASPTTLNVFSTGATNVFRQSPSGPQAATGGEIVSGNQTLACYDGTRYQLIDTQSQFGGLGPLTNLASAATADLGTVPSHNVQLTGVVSITSFGSSASTTYPYYQLAFAGIMVLTQSAGTLNLPGAANITTAVGDTATALYIGAGQWSIINYSKTNGTAVVNPTPLAGFLGLSISGNAGTSVSLSYNSAVIINATGNVPTYVTSGSFTINLTTGTVTSTCNGMDGEARGTSAWIYMWVISDGTTPCAIGSTSSSAPTMPTNYIYKAYAGAMRVNGAGNLLTTVQKGNQAQYVTGSATVPTLTGMASASVIAYTAIPVAAFIPATATRITTAIEANAGSRMALVPNNTGYPFDPAVNVTAALPCFIFVPAATAGSQICDLLIESANIYYNNTNTNNGIYAFGWRDAVNAN